MASKLMPEEPSEHVVHCVAWLGEKIREDEIFIHDQLSWSFIEKIYREIYKRLPEQK